MVSSVKNRKQRGTKIAPTNGIVGFLFELKVPVGPAQCPASAPCHLVFATRFQIKETCFRAFWMHPWELFFSLRCASGAFKRSVLALIPVLCKETYSLFSCCSGAPLLVRVFCPEVMFGLGVCGMHHLLAMSLLWLGIFQILLPPPKKLTVDSLKCSENWAFSDSSGQNKNVSDKMPQCPVNLRGKPAGHAHLCGVASCFDKVSAKLFYWQTRTGMHWNKTCIFLRIYLDGRSGCQSLNLHF